MPFTAHEHPELPLLETVLSGRVTDDELLDYYRTILGNGFPRGGRELVDATAVTDLAVTPQGYDRLTAFFRAHLETLRGVHVAMVAPDDYAFGMFRMWELQREDLGYEVRVFRSRSEATAWLGIGERPPPSGSGPA